MDNCSTVQFVIIMEEVNHFATAAVVEPEVLADLTGRLVNITTTKRGLFSTDLNNTLNTLDTLLRFDIFCNKV